MKKINLVKGMSEVLPAELKKYEYLSDMINDISKTYGYRRIKTPLLHKKEAVNDFGDNNFCFKDEEQEEICLRPSGSIPLIQTIVYNKLYLDPHLPLKFSYLDNIYKYYPSHIEGERETLEYGFECFGEDSSYLNAELILMATRILYFIGLDKVSVRMKNISKRSLSSLKGTLLKYKVDIEDDNSITNSDNLFSDFIFEIDVTYKNKKHLVAKGGGHTNIVKSLGNKNHQSVGFSFNIDKMVDLMNKLNLFPDMSDQFDFYVFSEDNSGLFSANFVSLLLRDVGLRVDVCYTGISEVEAIKKARRKNIPYAIIVGESFEENEEVEIINVFKDNKSNIRLEDLINGITHESEEKH